jgi:two-component system response regulator HydG
LISKNVLPWEIIIGSDEDSIKNTTIAERINIPIPALKDAASQAEYETIIKVLKQVKFNKTKAADILKIDRKTLYNKIRNFEENKQ